MAVRDDWEPGEILTAGDLNDTFGAKLNTATPTFTTRMNAPAYDYEPQYTFASDIYAAGLSYDETANVIALWNDYGQYFQMDNVGNITSDGGGSLGAWASWTPTWVNWSAGNALNFCASTQLGRIVFVRFRFDMGTTTTYSGNFQVTGAPAAKAGGYYMTGTCAYLDSSLGNSYNGNVVVNGTSLEFYNNAATSRSAIGSTTPFTWASTDLIYGLLVYEAATSVF